MEEFIILISLVSMCSKGQTFEFNNTEIHCQAAEVCGRFLGFCM